MSLGWVSAVDFAIIISVFAALVLVLGMGAVYMVMVVGAALGILLVSFVAAHAASRSKYHRFMQILSAEERGKPARY